MDLGGEPEKPALEQYGVDLTARAKAGKLDPVIGRDAEVDRTIQILSRRTKNNPVLYGGESTRHLHWWTAWIIIDISPGYRQNCNYRGAR